MRFFEKKRPEIFLHTAKFRRDKKTGRRLWQFTLIVTFLAELAESCGTSIAKEWQYLTDPDAAAVESLIASEVPGCGIEFFAEIDDADPTLHLDAVDLAGLRMTRDKQVVEFWFGGEHENSDELHAFMKKFAYTRCWAQFSPEQRDLPMKLAAEDAAQKPQR